MVVDIKRGRLKDYFFLRRVKTYAMTNVRIMRTIAPICCSVVGPACAAPNRLDRRDMTITLRMVLLGIG